MNLQKCKLVMYDIHRKTTSIPGISPFKMWEGLEELTEVQ